MKEELEGVQAKLAKSERKRMHLKKDLDLALRNQAALLVRR